METKFIRLPFDIENAKKIQSGEIEGRIFDIFYKCPVRIVDFNFQSAQGKLNIAISEIGKGEERYSVFNDEGILFLDKEGRFDDSPVFIIEVPECINSKYFKFKTFDKVLVRESKDFPWRIDLFSHIQDGGKPYVCLYHYWKYCIPYEGNEHLLGTTKNPE